MILEFLRRNHTSTMKTEKEITSSAGTNDAQSRHNVADGGRAFRDAIPRPTGRQRVDKLVFGGYSK
jgi:hypothetical protein